MLNSALFKKIGGIFIALSCIVASVSAGDAVPSPTPDPVRTATCLVQAATSQKATDDSLGLFRTYEPTQIGVTWDHGDERNLDFTFSPMFPLLHGYYPDRKPPSSGEIMDPCIWQKLGVHPYFAGTIRESFYVNTRPSSPVVNKRFNPLLAFRRWYCQDPEMPKPSRFIEVVYAHESNGQDIASLQRFNDQTRVYLGRDFAAASQQDIGTAAHYARDSISRGWDYWGVHASYDCDVFGAHCTTQGRLDYYLRHGLLQGPAEEYNKWEPGPIGKRRRYYDGLSLHATFQTKTLANVPWLDGRFGFGVTTGTQNPTQYNTWRFELGLRIANVPLLGWYRVGYNSDLVDYYHHDRSVGVQVSFWSF